MAPDQMLDDARSILLTQAAVLRAVASSLDASLPSTVDKILSCRGHIIVCGAGTSHTVAIRFAHLLSSCGTPAFCLDALDSLHGASGAITGNDILYIITNRAQTPEVITLASVARRHGASIIVQTGNGGNARSSVESSDSPVTHSTTPFSAWQLRAWAAPTLPTL